MVQLPPDEVTKKMAKFALERSAAYLSEMAEQFANEMERGERPRVDGPEALRAFALAISAHAGGQHDQESQRFDAYVLGRLSQRLAS